MKVVSVVLGTLALPLLACGSQGDHAADVPPVSVDGGDVDGGTLGRTPPDASEAPEASEEDASISIDAAPPSTDGGIVLTGPVGQWVWFDIPGTQCGDGTETGMAVNIGTGTDLMIFMEGGGACWDEDTCNGIYQTTGYELASYVTTGYHEQDFWNQLAGDNGTPMPMKPIYGFMDRTNSANPYQNSSYVIIPYCTGDVFVGDAVQPWNSSTQPNMYYHGAANVAADLSVIAPSFPSPSRVTLLGMSAGAFGATANSWRVAEAFPSTRVDVVADSGPAFDLANGHAVIQNAISVWKMASSGVVPPDCPLCLTDLRNAYGYYSKKYPSSRFAVLSWDSDDLISLFYNETPYPQFYFELLNLEQTVLDPLPNLKYFVPSNGPGHLSVEHTMLTTLTTTVTTNAYNPLPFVSHATAVSGDWLNEMKSDSPDWKNWTGQ